MLFRGQNILGYRPYADDVVEYFVQKSVANGIDIIRIFDCLNDMQKPSDSSYGSQQRKSTCTGCNVLYSWEMLIHWSTGLTWQRESKIWVQILSVSKIWQDFLLPYQATELVTALKEAVNIPIEMHTHYTSGVASMTYLKVSRSRC